LRALPLYLHTEAFFSSAGIRSDVHLGERLLYDHIGGIYQDREGWHMPGIPGPRRQRQEY
jgi:hypothetical protein